VGLHLVVRIHSRSASHNEPPSAVFGRDNAGPPPRTPPPHDAGVRRGDPGLARWGASGAADPALEGHTTKYCCRALGKVSRNRAADVTIERFP
jgi:hypothetical protein